MKYDLGGMHVAILVTDGFEQSELAGPREALDEAGALSKIVSERRGTVQGFRHKDKGDAFEVDLTFDDADPEDFDAVLLPGGEFNAGHIRMIPQAQQFVRQIDAQGKPIAVICHGGWLLASAGLVRGRTMTSFPGIAEDLRQAGASWVDEAATVDRNLVSSRTPEDIPAFNERFLGLLKERFAASVHGTNDQAGSAVGASS